MIWVALAGGTGAALRLMVDGFVRSVAGNRLPWGTLLINVVGSAGLGALLAAAPTEQAALVLGTGLMGGFTTFSTASYEAAMLALDGRLAASAGYAFGTLATSVGAVALAYFAASTAF